MFKNFFQQLRFRKLARQLRKPSGTMGNKVAFMMNKANEYLYDFTLETMDLKDNETVLEIGFGNGLFFEKVFSKAANLQLTGVDFSETMLHAARENNQAAVSSGRLSLQFGDSANLLFEDHSFDKVFCINVAYFWDDPSLHLKEVNRVLKPGGKFYATVRTKESMEHMPFTRYGFRKYTEQEWKDLLARNNFNYTGSVLRDDPPDPVVETGYPFQSVCFIAEKK